MKNVCVTCPKVRKADGTLADSKLFQDLMHYTKDRATAKEHYALATNKEFLETVKDRIQLDENGEITLDSYNSIVAIDEGDSILETLNKDIESGIYSYEDAMKRLQNFNRNSPFNKKYMAVVSPRGDQYKLKVVKRTKANEAKLENIVHKQTIQDRIIYYLNRAGVGVEFMTRDGFVGGRYSTINAQKSADGLYQLIRIANGEHVLDDLAEEAGHFAIGALGNTALVERLMSTLTEDVQKAILGEKYDDKALGANPRREVAGVLVGRALTYKVDDKTPWQRLAYRIAYTAKKIFYSLKGDEVKAAVLQAERDARKIAEGFMSPNFDGTVETALETQETLYDAKPSYNVTTFRKITQRLRTLTGELKSIARDDFSRNIEALSTSVEAGRGIITNRPGILGDNVALEGIAEALASLLGVCDEAKDLVDSIDFENIDNFQLSMPENGRKLRKARVFLTNSHAIESVIVDALADISGKQKLKGQLDSVTITKGNNVLYVNLKDTLEELASLNRKLLGDLQTKEFQFFSRFLQDSYGEKYITYSTRRLFKREGGKIRCVMLQGETKDAAEEIEARLLTLESDINPFERLFTSMSNNPDLIGQICDKVSKEANKIADDSTNMVFDQLRVLRERLKELGHKNTSFLFEKGRDGKLTGNIISDKNWGDWEADREEFFKSEKEAFLAANPNLSALSEIERAVQWDLWMRPKYKQWNAMNSQWYVNPYDPDKGSWGPNNSYYNPEFENIVPMNSPLRVWYNDFMELKNSLDMKLPEGSTISVRMPQFKGTFTNKMQNRRLYENGVKAFGKTLRSSFLENFCESSEDQDFGSMQTYNSEEEQLFHNPILYEIEKMHRLPIFGINKLKDMGDLSTDLFHTTLAYASMANSYMASSSLVDVMEVGTSVLQNRAVKGVSTEKEKKDDHSNAYKRYIKFVEKQIYGISMKKHQFGKLVWEKVTNSLNRLSAYRFLAGNVAGGLTNTGTGFIEIFKEAATGEYYTLEDWRKANSFYFGSFIKGFGHCLMDWGKLDPDNKRALFVRYFNMLNENRQNYREFNTRNTWLHNVTGKFLFLPYKSGDHYMQCMSYFALGNHIKLYDKDGKQYNVMDAYSVVDNVDPQSGTIKGKTLKMTQTFYKTKDGQEQYDLISSLMAKIANSNILAVTQKEADFLNNKGYNINDPNILNTLDKERKDLIWGIDDESKFMDQAREINDRLHGIYNSQDKVAFSQSWYGSALLAMKGWALGMAQRRFARNHHSVILGQDVEGSLVTLSKVLWNCGASRQDLNMAIRAILLPFGKNAQARFQRLGYSSNQWKNMKRNFFDNFFILALLIIRAMSALGPDDDETSDEYYKAVYGDDWQLAKASQSQDNDVALGLVHYFSNRLYREQTALNTPLGFYYESTSLFDLAPAGFSALFDIGKFAAESAGLPFADEGNSFFYYQSSKKGYYEKGDTKAGAHLEKMTPYVKSKYVFTQPYEATKSYEYGRNVKNR